MFHSVPRICLFFLGFSLVACFHTGPSNTEKKFIVMIDAGSSGSRIFALWWDKKDLTGIPILKSLRDKEQKEVTFKSHTGISTYEDPIQSAESLRPLLKNIKTHLSSAELKNTYIFLRATAGMRLIDPKKASVILSEIVHLFKVEGFRTDSKPEEIAQILPAREEGAYAWLGVNYLLGNLNEDKRTVGVLDLGGASNQISFEKKNAESKKEIVSLVFGKQTYKIFTHSFLGLGLNEARKKIDDPSCSSKTLSMKNFERCSSLLETKIKKLAAHDANYFKSIEDQIRSSRFYLVSAYFYNYQIAQAFCGKSPDCQKSWYDTLKLGGNVACNKSLDELKVLAHSTPVHILEHSCFNSSYNFSLLKNFGFRPESDLSFKENIPFNDEEIEVGWHIGAVIQEAMEIERRT